MDKPYSKSSGWGVNFAYTLSKGEQNGNDLFSLDGVTPDAYGWRPRTGDERHRVVVGAIVDLPYNFRLSTLSQFGSGAAYQINDFSGGFGINDRRIRSGYPDKDCVEGVFAFCEVNVTLENEFKVYGGASVNLAVDFLNIFNNRNFAGFDDFVGPGEVEDAPRIGNRLITLPRRIQLRAGMRFCRLEQPRVALRPPAERFAWTDPGDEAWFSLSDGRLRGFVALRRLAAGQAHLRQPHRHRLPI
jgi:hypothetical protein